MAHHKRKRHKNARSGCLYCKPNKANGQKATVKLTATQKRADISAREQMAEAA